MRPPSQFGEDITNQTNNEEQDPRMIPMMICTRLAGRAVIRVVGRCNDAKENSNLGKYTLLVSLLCFIFNVLLTDSNENSRPEQVHLSMYL